ncbi:cytochrome c oxidase subunit II [Dongia soli]|uniref:Cytochrome c oxidase subunit 2 n=1 Tax=Dongia soli TaxID=600628 RepID=A0ABU5ECU4_9PROT|nr:cytochrome c oxidase subunit II [Dongia soli]MDY0883977.1 cytochrome c oxidase subunit II [Dongia soli]
MSLKQGLAKLFALIGTMMLGSGVAVADEVVGAPRPKQLGLQEPATDLMRQLETVHNHILMPIITIITLFVLVLLLICIFRFNEKANPVPSKTTHNTLIEVIWTVAPALVLVFIAIFSFPLLYKQLDLPKPDLTIRAIGHQWYWSYEYPDNGNFTFDANLVEKEQLPADKKDLYLLQADNEVVLPVGKNVRVQITATDVIHSWTVPSFGVKHDGVPGRVNESWFNIEKPGIYYGQCSELCGVRHGFMPITVRAVTQEEFAKWVADAQKKFAKVDGTPPVTDVAQTAPAAVASTAN